MKFKPTKRDLKKQIIVKFSSKKHGELNNTFHRGVITDVGVKLLDIELDNGKVIRGVTRDGLVDGFNLYDFYRDEATATVSSIESTLLNKLCSTFSDQKNAELVLKIAELLKVDAKIDIKD